MNHGEDMKWGVERLLGFLEVKAKQKENGHDAGVLGHY